jgi:pyruvate kinase
VRHAKIVCTLGPATDTLEDIRHLIDVGMDVARLNCSHGDHADHTARYERVRKASDDSGHAVGILADLQGPKIRLGTFGGPAHLEPGGTFTITTEEVEGDSTICGTTYDGLPGDCRPGDTVLIDDGKIALRVEQVTDTRVVTRVEEGGPISNHKGINLPGVAVSVPALSDKDIDDLRWALRTGVDFVALSFVRNASDVDDVHKIMDDEGKRVPVIAKIEKPQAVDHLEEVIDAFDGIMVARGDLGVELPLWKVPLVQKKAVEICRHYAKPVIVATQMLESMITNARPTRAEASDVANAVLDGADAVMLSGETSIGQHPFEAVRVMARIVEEVEERGLERVPEILQPPRTKGGVITKAAAEAGAALGAKYLVAFTQSGDSARRMSRLRSPIPLIAFSPHREVRSQLALSWGIETFLSPFVLRTDDMSAEVEQTLLRLGRCKEGDLIVIVAGSPPGITGSTNALRVHRIGDVRDRAAPAYSQR